MLLKKKQDIELKNALSANLMRFMKLSQIHEAELARLTSIPQPTLHKLLTGKTIDPRLSTLKILSQYFCVSIDELCSDQHLKDNRGALKGKPLPVISWSDCHRFRALQEKLCTSNWPDWVLVEKTHNDLFALRSKPSMESFFPRGTIFIVDAKINPRDGDFVVVRYDSADECTLRELSLDGNSKLLLPLNPHAKPEKLTKSISFFGVVIESRFSHEGGAVD